MRIGVFGVKKEDETNILGLLSDFKLRPTKGVFKRICNFVIPLLGRFSLSSDSSDQPCQQLEI